MAALYFANCSRPSWSHFQRWRQSDGSDN